LVALLVAVIVVCGIALPVASRTVPTMEPVSNWPNAVPTANNKRQVIPDVLVIFLSTLPD
jgi:hypothetical protein